MWVNGRSGEGVDWLRITRICVWSRDVQPRHGRRCCDWPFSFCSKGNVFPWLTRMLWISCQHKYLEVDTRQYWEANTYCWFSQLYSLIGLHLQLLKEIAVHAKRVRGLGFSLWMKGFAVVTVLNICLVFCRQFMKITMTPSLQWTRPITIQHSNRRTKRRPIGIQNTNITMYCWLHLSQGEIFTL